MMLIRTQDKKYLININHVFVMNNIHIATCIGKDSYGKDNFLILGTYSSEKNSIKVMDMIQKVIVDNKYMEIGEPRMFSKQHGVFEMPKDDEIDKMMEYLYMR